MAGVHMQFNITDTGVKQLFTRMSNADFSEMNDEMGQALVAEAQERFDKSQAPDGSTWQQSQRAIEDGGKTLIDSSILLTSITSKANDEGFIIGTPEIYGAIHHFGGATGRNGSVELPARPILGLEAMQQERLEEVWLGWLDDEAQQ